MLKELQKRAVEAKGNFMKMMDVDRGIMNMLKELVDELTKDSRKLVDYLIEEDETVKYIDNCLQVRDKIYECGLNVLPDDVMVYRVPDSICAYNEIKIIMASLSVCENINLIVQEGKIFFITQNDFEPVKYCTTYRSISKCVNRLKKHLVYWIEQQYKE